MTNLIILGIVFTVLFLGGAVFSFLRLKFLPAAVAGFVWLLVVAGAAIAVVPRVVELNDFKPQIIAAVSSATGRELTIGGRIGFTLWPVLGLDLSDVTFANAAGVQPAKMIAVKSAAVGVALMPLFEKRVEIQQFRLVEPVIALSTNAAGEGNWEFKKANPEAAAETATEKNPRAFGDLQIANFEVVDGRVSYHPHGKPPVDLTDVNVSFSLPSLDAPLKAKGSATFKGREVGFNIQADKPRAFVADESSPLRATVSAGSDTMAFDGTVKNQAFTGTINGGSGDLSGLAAWASGKAAAVPFKKLQIASKVSGDAKSARLEGLNLSLDDTTLAGKASVRLEGKPSLTADLDVGVLDLDKFSGGEGGTSSKAAAVSSKAPDLSFLDTFNADITARLAGLVTKGVTLGATTAKVKVSEGRADVSASPASLYGGTVQGRAGVGPGAADRLRRFYADATLDGVEMEPLLTKFANFTRLSGKGDATLSVTGQVASPEGMKRSLNGGGRVIFRDGSLKGVNLAGLVRDAKSMLRGGGRSEGGVQQTDFTEMSGSYTIDNGIVTNNDLQMLSPLLRVGGKGTINLPASTVDYRIQANLVTDIRGQGGAADVDGLVVPINVRGPFDKISYTPDLQGLVAGNIQSVPKLIEGVKDLKGKDLEKTGKSALEGLLGIKKEEPAPVAPPPPVTLGTESASPAAPAPAPAPAQNEKPAEKLLKDLLGG